MHEAKWIWGKCHLPKTSFIHQLATQDKLLTVQRMLKPNLKPSNLSCVLCEDDVQDSLHHLFFECTWSRPIWGKITGWLEQNFMPSSIDSLYRWLKGLTEKKEIKMFFTAVFSAAFYYVWITRCRKFHKEHICDQEQIGKQIKGELAIKANKLVQNKKASQGSCIQKYRINLFLVGFVGYAF